MRRKSKKFYDKSVLIIEFFSNSLMESSKQSASSTGNSSFAISEERFHGILDVPKKRLYRKSAFDLISYIYSQYKAPSYYLISISTWRALQFLVPGFFAGNKVLYPENELMRYILAFFSFFNRIVPTTVEKEYFIPFTGAYLCLIFLFFLVVIICSNILQKSGKINIYWCKFLVLFFEGPLVLLPPIMLSQAGGQLGLIFIEKGDKENVAVWILFVLLVLFHLFITFFHTIFIAVSLTFRPTSLATFYFSVQFQIINIASVLGFIGSISPYCPKIARYILYVLTILLSIFTFIWNFGYFQIINSFFNSVLMSMIVVSLFSTIVSFICDILKKSIPAIILLCDVLVLIIGFLVFYILRRRSLMKIQVRLDLIESESEDFDSMKITPFDALSLAINGFTLGHQFVLSWDYFRLITDRWPNYVPSLIIWARFCSAFPEETGDLLWIDNKIKKLKLHKNYASHLRAQIIFLARQREDSMTHTLKKKINKAMREVQFGKNRLRHFWECVIQGNLVDMEAAAVSAQMSIRNAEFDMLHLINAYPNNSYVARVYSRFLLNVKGDKLEYVKWRSNCDLLKSGQKIVQDQAQQETLNLFPNILSLTVKKQRLTITTGLFGESTTSAPSISSSSCQIEEADEDHSILMNSVRDSIRRMKIPAISCIRVSLIIFILIFIVIWLPAIYIIYYVKSDDTFRIIELSCKASFLRNSLSLIMLQSLFRTSYHLNIFPTPIEYQDIIDANENYPNSGGFLFNSTEDFANLMTLANVQLDDLREISKYDLSKNVHLRNAQSSLFDSKFRVTQIVDVNLTDNTYSNQTESKSVESAVLSILMSCREPIYIKSQEEALRLINSGLMPNMYVNFNVAIEGISTFCKEMTQYTSSLVNDLNNIVDIISYVGFALASAFTIGMMIYAFIEIRKQKRIIIHAFMTIPKHVISKIVDTLKINAEQEIEAETSNDETGEITRNKQEENFLALLGTTSSKSVLFSAVTIIMVSIFLMGLGTCLNVYNGVHQIQKSANIILYAAPDVDYLYGSITEFSNGLIENFRLAMLDSNFPFFTDGQHNRLSIIESGDEHIQKGRDYFYSVRFGNAEMGIHDIGHFDTHLVNLLTIGEGIRPITSPLGLHYTYESLSSDSLILLYSVLLPRLFRIARYDTIEINPDMLYLTEISTGHLYHNFFNDDRLWLPGVGRDEFDSKFTFSLLYTFLIYLAIFIFIIVLFVMLSKVNASLKWMTEALLQCPPEVLMNSKQIVRLITGHFKEKKMNVKTDQNDQYYDEIVDKFIDSVIFVKPDLTIVSANPATVRVIGVNPEEVTGKHLREILKSPATYDDDTKSDNSDDDENNEGSSIDRFFTQINEALNGRKSFNFNYNVESLKPDGSSVFLNISVNAITKKGFIKNIIDSRVGSRSGSSLKHLIIVFRDISQSILSKRLLKEERMRSENLLRHILPPVIVDGLQRGESDVSFGVVSASIVFMDIVSFTPWCASNTAQGVMSTLNRLFKELDWILSLHPTLTKMKCIGDCYVAAGGIFEDPNVPEIHAKEMTHFGCLATKAVTKVNGEIGQNLRIRVGINTGGPIAAGVLGVDRPTFEIFGPTINMAQQMEHHGVPMMVHVSRSVYELIYSGDFSIKERGEIEVKNKMVTTYLVDPEPVEYPPNGP